MSKLGTHTNAQPTGLGDFLQQTHAAGSPVSALFALDIDVSPDVAAHSPGTLIVFRTQKYGADNGMMYQGDPIAAGRAWVDVCWPTLQQNPAQYYAIINEPGRGDVAGLTWICNFYIGAMQRADELGIKLCVGEWSTGMPPIEHALLYVPMLRYAMAHGHILGLHEYSLDEPMIGSPLCLRYRELYAALPVDARPPLMISEAGPGAGYDTGWVMQAYIDVVAPYDAEVMLDNFVIGVALFKLGKGESDMAEVMPLLTDYVATHPTPPEPEPSMSKGGLHLSANGNNLDDPWLPDEIQCLQVAHLDRVKIMTNGNPQVLAVFRDNGASMIGSVVRLYAAGDNAALGNPTQFYQEQRAYISAAYALGVRLFEIHNEPNLENEGYNHWWTSPQTFADNFYAPVARLILAEFPQAQLVYPGLSPRPDWAAWKPSISALIAQGLVQYVGVHCYWDSIENMRSPGQGRTYERFADLGKPLLITEASWNTPTGTDAQKGTSYAEYIVTLPSYVASVYFFVSWGPDYDGSRETWVRGSPPTLTDIPAAVGAGATPPPPTAERVLDYWEDMMTGANLGSNNPIIIIVAPGVTRLKAHTKPKPPSPPNTGEIVTEADGHGHITGAGVYAVGAIVPVEWLP